MSQTGASIAIDTPPIEGFAEIEADLWRRFDAATCSGKHAFHLPTLASLNAEGQPDARIVVLRRADADIRRLCCHTDRRSPKAHALNRIDPGGNPVSWVFYDAAARLQARVFGAGSVHADDELADAQWAASNLSSRRCYTAPHAPGLETDEPDPNLPEPLRDIVPSESQAEPGRANFAVIACQVHRIDWLYLHHAGHRRAELRYTPSGMVGRWLAV